MKRYFAVGIIAVLAIAIMLLPRPGGDGNQKSGQEVRTGAVLEGVSVTSTNSGRKLWTLETGRAVMSVDMDVANLGPLVVTIPSEDMTVEAGAGVYDVAGGDLSLFEGVRAVSGTFTMEMPQAMIKADDGTVSSESEVKVTGSSFVLEGRGLIARGDEVRILEDVSAQIR